jgi:tripartite-type tricarboxylate transporter receptor subunit TctC
VVAVAPGVLVVPRDSPHRDMASLINSGLGAGYQAGMVMGDRELHMTSSGVGSVSHLLGLRFAAASGVDAQHTPRAPGEFARAMDGETGFAFVPLPQALPLLAAGRIRALGRSGTSTALLDGVPPIEAAGPEGFADLDIPYVLLGRGDPPAGFAQRLREALSQPAVAGALRQAGYDVPGTADAAQVMARLPRWQAIADEVRPAVD